MNINTKSLFSLTRQARAIKDRGALSPSGQTEVKTLVKCERFNVDVDNLNGNNLAVNKSKNCRHKAITLINELYGWELKENHTRHFMAHENLFGIPHARWEEDEDTLHLLSLPYSLNTMELTEEDYVKSSGFEETRFNALGLLYLSKLNGFKHKECLIHYVYVDTPPEYIMAYSTEDIHVFGDKMTLADRVVTIKVELTPEDEELIKTSLEQTNEFIQQYKNTIK